jgi:hypothetical protein
LGKLRSSVAAVGVALISRIFRQHYASPYAGLVSRKTKLELTLGDPVLESVRSCDRFLCTLSRLSEVDEQITWQFYPSSSVSRRFIDTAWSRV